MKADPTFSLPRALALAALAVLAPLLGGSTELWARGTLLLATAAVLLVWPPRRTPGGLWLGLGLGLAALGAVGFLPAGWFTPPVWRRLLVETFGVPLPETMSAQPWLSAEAAGLYWSGIVFALALVAHGWDHEARRPAARLYALGMLMLAGLAIGSLLARWPVPWWPRPLNSGIEFGFFPNRNQTANVLALAAIMVTALGFEALGRRRPAGYAWFAGLALLGVALVIAFSRAGIVVFFAGTAVWVLMSMRFSASKKGPTLALAAVVVLLTGFFLFGGETLQRFQRTAGTPGGDYRMEIQRDAWRLAAAQPWRGQGMGNFAPIFAVTCTEKEKQGRAIHPESDWLWAAVELGWPAVVLLGGALGLWLVEALPLAGGTDRHLRSAALVCGVAFALHGLVDVAGHRAGSLWPALFLFSLARHPARAGAERRWVAPAFRGAAVLMAAVGAWWLASVAWPARTLAWPTSATLAWLETRLEQERAADDRPAALATVNAALRIAPLRWELYAQRAVATLAAEGDLAKAAADYDVARFLEPRWVEVCLAEGKVWLALDETELTIDAWTEALRRAGAEAPAHFHQMLTLGWSKVGVRAGLARVATTNPDLLLHYLDRTDRLEFDLMAARLLDRDPNLATFSAEQKTRLFSAWYRVGDRDRLIELMVKRPEWQEYAWLRLAQHYALKGDLERAWGFAAAFGPKPPTPQINSGQSLAELERAFHVRPDDFQVGLELYLALRKLRQNNEALATLQAVDAIAGRPAYVPYLVAELWGERGEWEKAWTAWQRYAESAGIR